MQAAVRHVYLHFILQIDGVILTQINLSAGQRIRLICRISSRTSRSASARKTRLIAEIPEIPASSRNER